MRIEKSRIANNDKEALNLYLQMVGQTSDGSKTIVEDGDFYVLTDAEPMDEPTVSYEELVASKIRERYSINDELAILRQRDTKPQEYADYFAYCEQCKAEAREVTNG